MILKDRRIYTFETKSEVAKHFSHIGSNMKPMYIQYDHENDCVLIPAWISIANMFSDDEWKNFATLIASTSNSNSNSVSLEITSLIHTKMYYGDNIRSHLEYSSSFVNDREAFREFTKGIENLERLQKF